MNSNVLEFLFAEVAVDPQRIVGSFERDLDRVVNLLRDLDKGFWKFITSYNDQHHVLPHDGDPVFAHFLPLDLIPFVEIEPRKWAQVGAIPHDAWFGVSVAALAVKAVRAADSSQRRENLSILISL